MASMFQNWKLVLLLAFLVVGACVPGICYYEYWNLENAPKPWGLLGILIAGYACSLILCRLFKQRFIVSAGTLLTVVLFSICANILINRDIYYHLPQLPHAVLLTSAGILASYAVLRRVACVVWTLVLSITFIQSMTMPLMGIVLDSTVIAQIMDATAAEVQGFATFRNLSMIIAAVLLCACVSCIPFLFLKKERTLTIGSTAVLILCLFFLSRQFFVARACNHPNGTWPVSAVRNLTRNVGAGAAENERLLNIIRNVPSCASKPSSTSVISGNEGVICMLHIGESTRADHFSINGYYRNTTPLLAKRKNLINYSDCIASAGITTYSFITILTDGRRGLLFNPEQEMYPSTGCVLDLFHKHKFDCYGFWGPDAYQHDDPGNCTFSSILFEFMAKARKNICPAGGVMGQAQEISDFLKKNPQSRNCFIIINNQGSHMPFHMYDDETAVFLPTSKTAYTDSPMLNPETAEKAVNAYDNTIYTLDKSIEKMLQGVQGKPFIYMYVGDHGEYFGDSGIWSRSQVTKEELFYSTNCCKVPFFIIYSPEFVVLNPHFAKAIDNLKKNTGVLTAHEHVFHTLLGIFGINTPYYNEELDLSSPSVKPYSGLHPGSFSEPKQEISQ